MSTLAPPSSSTGPFSFSAVSTPQSAPSSTITHPSSFAFSSSSTSRAPAFTSTLATTPFSANSTSVPFGTVTAPLHSLPGTSVPPAHNITIKSKISDLPDDYQRQVKEIADMVKQQSDISDTLSKSDTNLFLIALQDDIDRVRKLHAAVSLLLEQDMTAIQSLRASVREELNHVDIEMRLVGHENTSHYSVRSSRYISSIPYLKNKCEELCSSATNYAHRINELEDHLRSLVQSHGPSPQTVVETVRAQNNTFLALAGQVSSLHTSVERLREQFAVYRREAFSSLQV